MLKELPNLNASGVKIYYDRMGLTHDKLAKEIRELSVKQLRSLAKDLDVPQQRSKDDFVDAIFNGVVEYLNKPKAPKNGGKKEEKVPEEVKAPPEPQPETKEEPTAGFDPKKVSIDPKYSAMFPEPREDQMAIIRDSIQEDGLQVPIEVLPDGRIFDGHTRFRALNDLGVELKPNMFVVVEKNDEDIEHSIVLKNLARRQLDDLQRAKLVEKYMPKTLERIRQQAAEDKKKNIQEYHRIQRGGGDRPKGQPPRLGQDPSRRAASKVAEVAGLNPRQQQRYDFVKKWCPEMIDEDHEDFKPEYKNETIGSLHTKVKEMKDYVEKVAPGELNSVDDGKLRVVYEKLHAEHGDPEPPPGPLQKEALAIKDMVESVLKKKYGGDMSKLDKWEQEIVGKIEQKIESHKEKRR